MEKAERGSSWNLIRLSLSLDREGTLLGPAWATLCGFVASGQIRGSWQDLYRFLLVVALMDPLMSAFRRTWGGIVWPASEQGLLESSPRIAFPYVQLGSPGAAVQRWLNRGLTWWLCRFWPLSGTRVISLLLICSSMMGIALILGTSVLAAILMGWVLVLVARVAASPLREGILSLLAVGLPWLTGQLCLGELVWPSAALAACASAAFFGWMRVRQKGERWGFWVLIGAQAAMVAALIALRRPIAAGLVVLALLPQMLVGFGEEREGEGIGMKLQYWLMVSILLGAISLG